MLTKPLISRMTPNSIFLQLRMGWLLVGLLTSGLLSAQGTFSRSYGKDQLTHITAVVTSGSGDYAMAGITYPIGKPHSDLWIARVDPYGEPVWQRTFETLGPEHVYDLVETRDGNLTLLGVTAHIETGYPQALVMQLNRHGEVMWSKRFGGTTPGGSQLRALTQTADGGFVAAGFTRRSGKQQEDIWLVRLDATGNQRWERHYGGHGLEMAHSVIETQDGSLVIGGAVKATEGQDRDPFILRVDRFGKGVWSQVLNQPGPGVIEQLVETPTGSYLAAGWSHASLTESVDGHLWQISPSGTLEWEETHGGGEADAFYDLIPNQDGGYVAMGRTASFDYSPDLWLMAVDKRGKTQWQERTRGDKAEWGHSIAMLPDGTFLLGGATQSFSETDAINGLLIHTDHRGRFGANASSVTPPATALLDLPTEGDGTPEWFKPNLYILSIGVSDYANEPINLSYAHTDAEDIAERFQQLSGSLFSDVQARVLTNEAATLANIKSGIAWLEQEATQLDVILIFLSSHGALDHKGNLYLLPHDVETDQLFATGLDIRAITEGMNGVPCKKLVLLDACHSGQSGNDLLAIAKGANVNEAVEELLNREAGLTVMTSSSGSEFSYENPIWGHGAFTKAILEGLDGNADYNLDQVIHLTELNLYVTQRVKDLTSGQQHPFTPINLFGDIPLFVLE